MKSFWLHRLALSYLSLCDRFRCNEITNLTMRDIEDLGSAIVVKVERFGLQSLGLAQKETLLDILVKPKRVVSSANLTCVCTLIVMEIRKKQPQSQQRHPPCSPPGAIDFTLFPCFMTDASRATRQSEFQQWKMRQFLIFGSAATTNTLRKSPAATAVNSRLILEELRYPK
ncbi:hypothetical protein MTP99_009089 [Tenebrio molitor]|nr:hypothetical protein MTP99_009089 [Tenebrio molitor]